MNEEKMYIPSGLKTRDGKDIMCYTGEFYLKNKEKIDKMLKKCEEILREEDKNIMHEFIEKIRNIEGSEEIMTNASRIINREIRKQRNEGREEGKILGIAEGIALVAKRLKKEMNIKDISRITGLSESDIENL